MTERQNQKAWLGWVSLLLAMLPFAFLGILIAGGGSGGFEAWNDLGRLLALMVIIPVLGILLFVLSLRRKESPGPRVIALIIHVALLFCALWAFQQ